MLNLTVNMKQNDREPDLDVYFTQGDGTALDITGGSVTFVMRKKGAATPKVNAAATIISAGGGHVKYAWASSDTDTVNTYDAEFRILFSNGEVLRMPVGEYITVTILPALS